jgi:hypothetical protein
MPFRAWVFIVAIGLIAASSVLAKDDLVSPEGAPKQSQQQATEEPTVEPAPIVDVAPTDSASDEHDQGSAANKNAEPEKLPYVFYGDRDRLMEEIGDTRYMFAYDFFGRNRAD